MLWCVSDILHVCSSLKPSVSITLFQWCVFCRMPDSVKQQLCVCVSVCAFVCAGMLVCIWSSPQRLSDVSVSAPLPCWPCHGDCHLSVAIWAKFRHTPTHKDLTSSSARATALSALRAGPAGQVTLRPFLSHHSTLTDTNPTHAYHLLFPSGQSLGMPQILLLLGIFFDSFSSLR